MDTILGRLSSDRFHVHKTQVAAFCLVSTGSGFVKRAKMKFKKLRNEKSSLPVKEWGDIQPFKTRLELNPKSSHSQTGFAGLFNSGG
jgi:hypothetical protein